jgi:hypothetical protein
MGILNEEWRDVVGYEGLYLVSNYGRVRRTKKSRGTDSRILAQSVSKRGYITYSLYRNQKRKHKCAHRLVAEAFLPRIEGKEHVNHIDGNKLNNYVGNLEWVTPGENVRHAIANGLLVPHPTEHAIEMAHKATMKPVIRSDGKAYESVRAASRDVGANAKTIHRALASGKKTKGFNWEYTQCQRY